MLVHKVRLPHKKASAEIMTEDITPPEKVVISMSQHIGSACVPAVKVGDRVKIGDVIGDNTAVMSAPIHSSVSGTVTGMTEITHVFGKNIQAVVIENDFKNEISDSVAPPVTETREQFIEAIRRSGSVGLGGAGFPTAVKLGYDPKEANPDLLIVNGAECEPYITSDYRCFIEDGEKIISGVKLIMRKLGIPKCIIAIEKNKPAAINKMKTLCEGSDADIRICALPSLYPQGAEKTLIYSVSGRVVKEGELPLKAGCIVINSSTVAFLSEYFRTGMPLVSKRVTVDGDIVDKPVNLRVPIGTPLQNIIDAAAGGRQPLRVLLGGPMMGLCALDTSLPLVKTGNAILIFGGADLSEQTACIRCGSCVRSCPMNLMPTVLEKAYDMRDCGTLMKYGVNLCMNCGVCSYVCPARRRLAEKNQLAKVYLRENKESLNQ